MAVADYSGGLSPEADVIVVTTNDVPGYEMTEVIGRSSASRCVRGTSDRRSAPDSSPWWR
jgi:hypothetical protein